VKIVRYQDKDHAIRYAALQADGTHRELAGDLYGELTPTDRPAQVEKILCPVPPAIIFGIGLNYRRHAEETNATLPEFPIVFLKNLSAAQHPGGPIELPTHLASHQVDYECELAVVIGKTCKNVSPEEAFDYILGYTCANDVSARDWQKDWGGGQWSRGKMFDTFAPMGPCLVTSDEILNPNALAIKTILNGETVQDWNTEDMIFDVPALVSFLSGSATLVPGTVILTGTPHGVGAAKTPPVWLQAGDEVTIEIEQIGRLTNPVQNEPRPESP
jgi:2-keto-4-pentenoate hydratase/2-oxohepta-3-ene-1,7-dioic acid hydratase in catechol pathway